MVHSELQNADTDFWQRIDGRWRKRATQRGGFQGMRLVTLLFCSSLEESRDGMPDTIKTSTAKPGYQDDNYLLGSIGRIAEHWEGILQAYARCGHEVNVTKSTWWIPGGESIPDEGLPPALQAFVRQVPRDAHGLTVMGGACQGEFAMRLGPQQLLLESAWKRLDAAKVFGQRIRQFCEGSVDQCSLHVAWCMTLKSLREALAYDIRIIPSDTLEPLLKQHAQVMRDSVQCILGRGLTDEEWQVVQLPGPVGGCSMRLPLTGADAAYYSTWLATKSRVEVLCQELGRPVRRVAGEEHAAQASSHLQQQGVCAGADGSVKLDEDALERYASSPWSADVSLKELCEFEPRTTRDGYGQGSKLMSRAMRCIEFLRASALYDGMSTNYRREVFLSAGGPQNGKIWNELPAHYNKFLGNDHFKMAINLRLGAVRAPDGATCMIAKAGDQDHCLTALCNPLVHPALCKQGPARLRPHRSVSTSMAKLLRKTGAHVDMERAVPELYMIDAE
eukprot:4188491-Karenia_brevis.AAC.1